MKKDILKHKKKIIIIVIILVVCIAIYFAVRKFESKSENEEIGVPVQSVAVLTGASNMSQNRFSGVVESEKTVKIQKQSDREIKQVYVEIGQTVKKGDKLFEYDTDELNTKIEQANLDVERMQNAIENDRKEIDAINAQKAANPGADHSEWNLDIQTKENEIRQTEYNIKSKNVEINKLRKQLKNVVVTAEIDGIVQSIGDQNGSSGVMYGGDESDNSYMSIMQTGNYRVKGIINEQNMYSINVGDKVVIHSRVDDKTWNGTVDNIDTSNPERSNTNMYYGGGEDDSMTRSSKYPFYIKLDNIDGLMMGQHVYIEKDAGQENKKEGLWIPTYFVVQDGDNSYIWVSNSKNKLEKRKIKIGEKNEELEEYQILEGLSVDDYIANPSEELKEGENVTKYDFIPVDVNDSEEMIEDFNTEEMDVNEEQGEEVLEKIEDSTENNGE